MPSLSFISLLLLGFAATSLGNEVTVGVFSKDDSSAWSKVANCSQSHKAMIECNLRLYDAAAETAARNGVQLLVFPEGYALGAGSKGLLYTHNDYFETFSESSVGSTPCKDANPAQSMQRSLSCSASSHQIGIAANILTADENGDHHITEVVFDVHGSLISYYHKWQLVPTEHSDAKPGPFKPTVFSMFGQRFGIIICYEGLYPYIPFIGSFKQLDSLVHDQKADAIIWSGGPLGGAMKKVSSMISMKYKVPVIGAEMNGNGVVVSGQDAIWMPVMPVADFGWGYTGSAVVQNATLKFQTTLV